MKKKKEDKIKCALCGHEYTTDEGALACTGCPFHKLSSCKLIKCPNCGYEDIVDSKILRIIKKLREEKKR